MWEKISSFVMFLKKKKKYKDIFDRQNSNWNFAILFLIYLMKFDYLEYYRLGRL